MSAPRLYYDHGAIWLYEKGEPARYLGMVFPAHTFELESEWRRLDCYRVILPDSSETLTPGYSAAIEALLDWHRARGLVLG